MVYVGFEHSDNPNGWTKADIDAHDAKVQAALDDIIQGIRDLNPRVIAEIHRLADNPAVQAAVAELRKGALDDPG